MTAISQYALLFCVGICIIEKESESSVKIPGEQIMGELVAANVVLIPMAVDPHGKWGPVVDRFFVWQRSMVRIGHPSYAPKRRLHARAGADT